MSIGVVRRYFYCDVLRKHSPQKAERLERSTHSNRSMTKTI